MIKAIQIIDYGFARSLGSLTGKGIRGAWKAGVRHPKVVRTAGAVGVGMLAENALAKRKRKRQLGYSIDVSHFTPDIPIATTLRDRALKHAALGKLAAKHTGTAVMAGIRGGVKTAVLALAIKEIADLLSRQPYMPQIRSDIEMGDYGYSIQTIDKITKYAGILPNPTLEAIKAKTGVVLQKTKKGAERGLLLWLMGFISAELLARGITTPKSKQEITLPQFVQPQQHHYAKTSFKDFGALTPAIATGKKFVAGWKNPRLVKHLKHVSKAAKAGGFTRRHTGTIAGGTLGILALRELRKIRKQQKYEHITRRVKMTGERVPKSGFQPHNPRHSATMGMEPFPKWDKSQSTKPGFKHRGKAGAIAATATLGTILALRALRRRKAKQQEGYSFRTAATKVGRGLKKVGRGAKVVGKGAGRAVSSPWVLPLLIASEFIPKRKQPSIPPVPTHPGFQPQQGYELSVPLSVLARIGPSASFVLLKEIWSANRRKKAKKNKKYALPGIGMAVKHLRSIRHLGKAKVLGKDLTTWSKKLADQLRLTANAQSNPNVKRSLLQRATDWDTVTGQASELIAKQQLDKIGLIAAGVAGGVAAHEVGKQGERERVRKAVG